MKKKLMMVAVLLGALSLGACVDDNESQSVTDLRGAKAAQLEALANLYNAQAAAEAAAAEAEAQLQAAYAAYWNAKAAAENAETANQQQLLEQAQQKFQYELAALQAEWEAKVAEYNALKKYYENELWGHEDAHTQKVYGAYAGALAQVNSLTQTKFEQQVLKAQTEAQTITAEESLKQSIADLNTERAQKVRELNTLTEMKEMQPSKDEYLTMLDNIEKEAYDILNNKRPDAKVKSDNAKETFSNALETTEDGTYKFIEAANIINDFVTEYRSGVEFTTSEDVELAEEERDAFYEKWQENVEDNSEFTFTKEIVAVNSQFENAKLLLDRAFEDELSNKDNEIEAKTGTAWQKDPQGNITWDVDYDARAYRADETGQVKLLSNSQQAITFALNNVATTDIPEDFDCICPYNVNEGNYKYTYNTKGELIQGGKGKNISYRFITTDLIEDGSIVDSRREAIYNEEFTFNTVAYNFNSLNLNYEGDDKSDSIPLTSGTKIFNYSNSEIAGKARGYQRDEIYRFGIVFYNSYGLNSSVHWIGDIRMPSSHDEGYEIFQSGGTTPFNAEYALITKPLGIEFEVNNLPKDAVRYEIVRCERTANDRTIVAQGAVSCVTNFDSSSSSLVPFPYMAYSTKHGYFGAVSGKIGDLPVWEYNYDFPLSENQSNNYFIFASPEICINQENSSQIIDKFEDIELLYYLTSPIRNSIDTSFKEFPTGFGRFAGNKKVFANATAFKANGTEIVPITESDMQRVNGFLGVFDGGPESSTKEPLIGRQMIVINGDGWYSALLAKYYMKTTPSEKHVAKVDDSALSIQCDPIWSENEGFTDKGGVAVGEKVYYNWVFESETTDVDEDANNVRKFGPHGICAVFKSDNMLENIPLLDSEANPYRTNGVALCNMKRTIIPYGGNSYTSIQNSTYVQTGTGGETAGTVKCFGGDTFIGILDYANMMLHFKADDRDKGTSNRCFIGAFIPCESTANLSLTHNPAMLHKSYDPSNGYANHFEQNDIVTYGEVYSQNMPLYAYNDAYSTEPTAKTFVSKSMYNLDNLTTDVRIMASEQKTNNEVYDSWTQFKVANYLDVDTRFGSINDMVLFKNKLLFWQTDAFGTASVNERSIITDNNPGELTLGTGGVLDRYDYFTTQNGKSDNHLRAHTQTDNTVYWFDAKRNEICGFDGNIQAVSKLKGVQSYLNENKGTFLPDPIAVYDKKYNEVLFTLKDNTLAFNEQISAFTSFYTYKPDYYAEFSDKLYVFKDLNLFKYNSGDTMDLYDDKSKVSYVKFIVNEGYPQTKTFDNVEYSGDFTYDTNFNDIYFETKRQTSYKLTDEDIDYREDTYKFCIPRNSLELNEVEQLANKSYKDRMKGKYLICHYKYDCNGGNTFKVPYISTAYRNSLI